MHSPRVVQAENPGPFTLDGTCTYLVGEHEVAVVDPGPELESHHRALLDALQGARRVHVLVTHHHPDHSGGARALARELGVPFTGPGPEADLQLAEGDRWQTDAGELVALETPGHSRDHVAFEWREARSIFVGDLILGSGETTWVGEYAGCVADYLASLERLRARRPTVLFPGHGPPIEDAEARITLFREHRLARIRKVESLLAEDFEAEAEDLLPAVYGDEVPAGLTAAAVESIAAILHYLRGGTPNEGEGARS